MVRMHLPNSNADDIIEELRSHILDAAQDNVTGEVSSDAVWKIIGSFGAPSEVAQQYLENETFEPQRTISHSDSILVIPKLQWVDILTMVIVTFFIPFQITFHGYGIDNGVLWFDTSLDAILWRIDLTGETGSWISPVIYGIIFGFFNIIFLIQFIRYYADKTTIRRLLFFGICTLILPMFSSIALLMHPPIESLYYAGPIPIQLATALLLLYYRGRIVYGHSSQEEIPDI